MSEIYILLAVLTTFAAIMLGGIAVEITVAEKRKTVQVLQSQVGQHAANLRQEELSQSFLERVLFPVVRGLGAAARRLTPLDLRRRLDHKLMLAGSPAAWDAERVAALKLLGLAVGKISALGLAGLTGGISGGTILMALLFGGIGYFAPDAILSGKVQRRQEAIRKALPDSMDLLTISVEAGLGFDAAMAQVVANVPGPLSYELGRMLHEMQLGMSRDDAFRKLAERTNVDELKAFIISMIQANKFGVGVAAVLRAQATELRTKRKQRAERKAMQTPVKILFPLIFCVLPALFVVVMGPGAIRIFIAFFGTGP
jgi:tight adherence protein C